MKILGLKCQILSRFIVLSGGLPAHTTYADLSSTIFCKYSLTPSCHPSTFLSLALSDGGTFTVTGAVQDSGLSVLNLVLGQGFGLGMIIN